MTDQEEKKYLYDAACKIKIFCRNHSCVDCPFYYPDADEECAISSRDYLNATYPQTWEVSNDLQ